MMERQAKLKLNISSSVAGYDVGCAVCNPDNPDGANLVFKCVCKVLQSCPLLLVITMFVQSSDSVRLY